MTARPMHGLLFGLSLVMGLLGAAPQARSDDDPEAYDVVIEVDDDAVKYNGQTVDGFYALEEALAEDVGQDPDLTVEVLAHDTVPFEHVMQIMAVIRQYDVSCTLEMVSRLGPPNGEL